MAFSPEDIIIAGNEPSELGILNEYPNIITTPNFGTSPNNYDRFDSTMTRIAYRSIDHHSLLATTFEMLYNYNLNRWPQVNFPETHDAYFSFRQVNETVAGSNNDHPIIIVGDGVTPLGAQFTVSAHRFSGEVKVFRRNPASANSMGLVVVPPLSPQTQMSKDMIRALFDPAVGGVLSPMGSRLQAGFPKLTSPPQIIVRLRTGLNGRVEFYVEGVLLYEGDFDLSFFSSGFTHARFFPIGQSTTYATMSEFIVSKSYPYGLRVRSLPAAGSGVSQQGSGVVPGQINASAPLYQHQDPGDMSLWTQSGVPGGYVPILVDQVAVVAREMTPAYGIDIPQVRLVTRIDGRNTDGTGVLIGPERNVIRRRMTVSPDTGLPWTLAEINGMQIGLRSLIPGA